MSNRVSFPKNTYEVYSNDYYTTKKPNPSSCMCHETDKCYVKCMDKANPMALHNQKSHYSKREICAKYCIEGN